MTKPKYQVMPVCQHWEDEVLEADIAERGLIYPIIRDQHGNTIDGHRRERVLAKLGVRQYPVKTIGGLDPEELRQLALELNTKRRHLTTRQKQELIAQELRYDAARSDRLIADVLGVTAPTVSKVRRRIRPASVKLLQLRTGKDGRRRKAPSRYTWTPRDEAEAQRLLRAKASELPARPLSARAAARFGSPSEVIQDTTGRVRCYCCDFRELPCRPGSVSLVFTDPPYTKDWLANWVELGRWALTVLKPGGVLAAHTGVFYLPDVIDQLRESLSYVWTAVEVFDKSRCPLVHPRQMANGYRPVLIFSKGGGKRPTLLQRHLPGRLQGESVPPVAAVAARLQLLHQAVEPTG